MLEDGGPLLELLDLRSHSFAGAKHRWNFASNLFGQSCSFDHVAGLDISDKLLNLRHERVSVSDAGLKLGKVVLLN